MGRKNKNEELQTRRQFFKKAANTVLPMLGAIAIGPSAILSTMSSCTKVCDGCEAACMDNCSSSCYDGCDGQSYSSSSCTGCSALCSNNCGSSCEGTAEGKPTTGFINGHEYVDLGLSVLWATHNIGAGGPSDLGTEYPFVLEEKYDKNDEEKWYREFVSLNLKPDSTISNTYLDIAKKKWGNGWKLPRKDEISELRNNCKVEVTNNGIKLISKLNGAEIILPIDYSLIIDGCVMWGGDLTTVKSSITKEDNTDYIGAYSLSAYDYGGNYGQGVDVSVSSTGETYKGSGIYTSNVTFYSIHLNYIRPVADRSGGNISTCNGNCTANCSSDCTSTCKNECQWDCKGNCGQDCTSGCKDGCKDSCNKACTRTCADACKGQTSQYCSNCASNCSSGCTKTCADTCKAQTSQYCSNCASNCSSRCTKTCADSCQAQTSQGCSGCSTTCKTGCGTQCYWSCGGSCDDTCAGNCITGCQGYSKGSCAGGTCFGSCSYHCSKSCSSYCYSSCKNMGING